MIINCYKQLIKEVGLIASFAFYILHEYIHSNSVNKEKFDTLLLCFLCYATIYLYTSQHFK